MTMLGEMVGRIADAVAERLRIIPRVQRYRCCDDSLLCDECGFFKERHVDDWQCPVQPNG